MNEIIKKLPPMKSGNELVTDLAVFPMYDESIRYERPEVRLTALSDLYNVYIPCRLKSILNSILPFSALCRKKGQRLRYSNTIKTKEPLKALSTAA